LQTDGVADRQTHEQYSQEVRLSGTLLDDRLNWTVGGFYYHADQTDHGTIEAVIYDLVFTVDSTAWNTNYAGFAHGEFKIVDGLTLIGGIRQTHEKKEYHFVETDIPGTRSDIFPGGLDVAKLTKYNRTDWRLGLQYEVTPEHMLYANVATGFRGGGFNPRPSTLADVTRFGPESLTTYEVGQRSEFFNRRVKWNNTFYYGDYKSIQLYGQFISDTPEGAYPVTNLTNAGKARIWGLESEFAAEVADGLNLRATGSYTNFRYLDLGVAAPLAGNGGPTLKDTQPFTPKWQFNVGFDAVLPVLQDIGTLTLTGDYSYQTKQYTDSQNREAIAIPSYGVANARLTFATLDGDWQFSVIGSNIFNKKYDYFRYYVSGDFQLNTTPAPGAEWAISARKKF
jgi:iron complex outermembrane receptor protein